MKKLLPFLIIAAVVGLYFFFSRDTVAWKTVQSSVSNLSFLYPARSSLGDEPLKGTVESIVAYDHIPDGIGDWTLSTAAKNAVLATMSCAPLAATGVYLPVDGAKPMQCGVTKSADGLVSAYMIGIGHPFEGTAYPESAVITFREADAAVLSKVVDFPVTEDEANEKVDAFVATHPSAVIWPPDENAKVLYSDVEAVVTAAVSTPSQEVKDGLETLKKIAETVKASN